MKKNPKVNVEVVTFKSYREFFIPEMDGLKNHTEREIDPRDKRFKMLERWIKSGNYGLITIAMAENPDACFLRQVRHVCKWKNLMIITWRP